MISQTSVPLGVGSSPIRIRPVDGESLDSWLTRQLRAMRTTHDQLIEHLQLTTEEKRESKRWGDYLPASAAERLSSLTGVPAVELHEMTLSTYNNRIIDFNDKHRVVRLRRWARASGTRYCPSCVEETGGVFLLRWRLVWSFACVRHARVLADGCPVCRRAMPAGQGITARRPTSGTCPLAHEVASRRQCGGDLRTTPTERLPAGHPILLAQGFVDHLIDTATQTDTAAILRDLQSAGRGIISARLRLQLQEAAGLPPGRLYGLEPDGQRPAVAAPHDALYMAAVVTWGLRLLSSPFSDVQHELRDLILNFQEGDVSGHSTTGLGSPMEVISRWGICSPALRQRMLASLDRDLKLNHRLVLGTARADTAAKSLRPLASSEVPNLLWPSWTLALDWGGAYSLDAFRLAMMTAVELANNERVYQQGGSGVLATSAWRRMRPVFFGDAHQQTSILDVISSLNESLRRENPVIDYPRRRNIAYQLRLMEPNVWRRICEHVGIAPGGETKALMARRYAFLRFVGTLEADIPFDWFRANRRDDSALYTSFRLAMTEPLQAEIDHYLQSALSWVGVNEPVLWAPNVPAGALSRTAGSRPGDFDKMHASLAAGCRNLSVLARDLGCKPRHVVLLVDERPTPGQRVKAHLSWTFRHYKVPQPTLKAATS